MSYVLLLSPTRMRLRCTEHLTRADMVAAITEMEAFERTLTYLPDRAVDLSAVTNGTLDYSLVSQIADGRRERRFPNSFRTAIIAPTQVTYGFARMFQALLDNPQIEVRIFDSEPAAESWLGTST